ncbi:MAG: hypothetical protein ABIZ80_07745, partial [Bryobacteraceae bacterium]
LADLQRPNLSLSNPFDASSLSAAPLPNLNVLQPHMRQTRVQTWGFSIEHQFGARAVLQVGYEGSVTSNDYVLVQTNDASPGSTPRQSRRPYPQFQSISSILSNGSNDHHGLEVRAERRAGPDGFTLQLAYTWSKTLDTVGGRLAVPGDPGGVSRNLPQSLNRGLSEANIPSQLVIMAGYESPFGKGKPFLTNHLMGKVLGGWTFQDILTMSHGPYFTPVLGSDRLDTGSTASSRPDAIRNPNLSSGRTPQVWFDTAAFATPAPFVYGNAGRSILEGPGLFNLDFALVRKFSYHDRLGVVLRFEAFNATNRTNFGLPGNTFGTATFGVVGSSLAPRSIQFGLKVSF